MKFGTPIEHSTKYMKRFDALELHAVRVESKVGDTEYIEQDDSAQGPGVFFSVYGHLIDPGGVFCLADFAKHAAAVKWMKAQHRKHKFELGYEDFWAHRKANSSTRVAGRRHR